MSGVWKRSMVEMVGHPRTKGRATGENKPRPKPPRHSSTLHPTVDRAPTDPEPEGHLGDRVAPVEFEQTEGATIGAEVVGRPQLTAEAEPLLGCQPHGAH